MHFKHLKIHLTNIKQEIFYKEKLFFLFIVEYDQKNEIVSFFQAKTI
jgi:hypothetical protein